MPQKISVIIPVFNPGEYFIPCLESVMAQTVFESMEIILVDDGSTDGSEKICDEYSEKYKNIIVHHQENSGVSVARNAGIEKATGEFIGFVDADDLIEPQMYERLYDVAKKTGADIAFCQIRHPYPDKEVIINYPFEKDVLLGKEKIRSEIADFMICDSSLNSLCNKIFSRSCIRGLSLTVGRKYGEDREFVLRALTASSGVCSTDYIGYYYRYVETSAVQKPRFDYGLRISQQYESDLELFARLGIDSDSFNDKSAEFLSSSIIGAVSFANNKFTGKDRKAVLESIVNDDALQKLLDGIWDKVLTRQSAFGVSLLEKLRKKSISGMRTVLLLMKIKVSLFNMIKGAK